MYNRVLVLCSEVLFHGLSPILPGITVDTLIPYIKENLYLVFSYTILYCVLSFSYSLLHIPYYLGVSYYSYYFQYSNRMHLPVSNFLVSIFRHSFSPNSSSFVPQWIHYPTCL
jgi:hypothetical protein